MTAEPVEEQRSPAPLAPHSEWHLTRAAEKLLYSRDAAAVAVREARARAAESRQRSESRAGDDAGVGSAADPMRAPYDRLFVAAGLAVTAVTGVLSVAAFSGVSPAPGPLGTVVTAGAGVLAGIAAAIACAWIRGRSPAAGDHVPVPAGVSDAAEVDRRTPSASTPGGQRTYPVWSAMVLAGVTACVVIWTVLLVGRAASLGLAVAGIALPVLVALGALPLAVGLGSTHPRRRAVRRLLADTSAARRMRRAEARARRILLDHERAWHRVILSAHTRAEAVPEPGHALVHTVLTALASAEPTEPAPLPPGAGGALHTTIGLLRATDPTRLRSGLEEVPGLSTLMSDSR